MPTTPRSDSTVSKALALVLVACAAVPCTIATRAHAQASGTNVPVGPRFVVLESNGKIDPAVEDAVRELFARISLIAVPRDNEVRGEIVARVVIEYGETTASVRVRDARGKAPDVTRDVTRAGSPSIFRETLAHIVLGGVEPLAYPQDAPPAPPPLAPAPPKTVTTVAPPPPETPKAKPGSTSSAPWFATVGVRAGGLVVGSEGSSLTGTFLGAGGAVGVGSPWRPAVEFNANYMFPVHPEAAGVTGKVELVTLRALGRVDLVATDRVALSPLLGGGVDILSVAPGAPTPTTSLASTRIAPTTVRPEPVVTAGLGGRLHASSRFDVGLAVGVDIDFASRRFLVDDGASRPVLFTTSRVRPFLALSFDIAVLGDTGRTQAQESDAVTTVTKEASR